jgi:hypothetical protein
MKTNRSAASTNVKTTLSLGNDLKLIRIFKIDINQYTSIKSEEDKRVYLLMKMEDDIKDHL